MTVADTDIEVAVMEDYSLDDGWHLKHFLHTFNSLSLHSKPVSCKVETEAPLVEDLNL